MSAAGAFESHLATWRAAEPAMEVAEAFVPPARRAAWRAWGVLRHELEAALFAPSDASLAAPKLAWWAEELSGPAARHPVARALAAAGARPGAALAAAAALLALAEDDRSPADEAAAVEALRPHAEAWLGAEAELFGSATAGQGAATAVAAGMLARWAGRAPAAPVVRARLPMNLLARHGELPAPPSPRPHGLLADLARTLAGVAPGSPASYPAAVRLAFDRRRIDRWARGRASAADPPALAALLLSWREARRCRPGLTATRRRPT